MSEPDAICIALLEDTGRFQRSIWHMSTEHCYSSCPLQWVLDDQPLTDVESDEKGGEEQYSHQ